MLTLDLVDHIRNAADASDQAPQCVRWHISATLASLALYLAHGVAYRDSLAGRLEALAEAVRKS